MGGHGTRLRLCPLSRLAILLNMVEDTGVWPQGLLDAHIAMIPKVDSASTPPGSTAPQCAPGCVQIVGLCWAGSPRSGLSGGFLDRSSVWVMGCRRLRLGFPLHLILRRSCLVRVGINFADVIKSFDTVERSILDCALGRLGLPPWFRKVYFAFHSQVRLRFKLAAGLGEPWTRDGGIQQGCPLSMVLKEALYVPRCRSLEAMPGIKPQHHADNLKCSALCPNALFGAARFTAR